MDRAPLVHPHQKPLARLQTTSRQGTQQRQLLGQTHLPVGVELPEQLTQERFVLDATAEIATAPQQQRLLQRTLEAVMTLLHVAVLVALTRLDRLTLQPVVTQQRCVALREGRRPFRPRRNGRRQPIGTMQLRHPAQFPQSVLQPLAKALEALGEAERAGLPVRVGQHEVVDQVLEHDPVDGHPQLGAVREVTGAQPAGVMHLAEEHLPGLPVQRPPLLDPTLQGTQLAVGETARVATLQIREQGLGLQAGIELQLLLQFGPDRRERIGAGTVVALHAFDLAGQPVEPAVLAGRLGVHAGAPGGLLFGDLGDVETAELAGLRIANHEEPPGGVPLGVRLLVDREF